MKASFSLLPALLLGLVVGGCTCTDGDEPTPTPDGIVGYWSLNKLECYCPSNTPTPNEAIEFDADGKVTEYANGQITQTGTYQLSTGAAACETNAPVVTITWQTLNMPLKATYSIVQDKLVIDRGLCFDAPRKTYKFSNAPRGTK
jgi:hypothetical protein